MKYCYLFKLKLEEEEFMKKGKEFLKSIVDFFKKPVESINHAVETVDWKKGLSCILLYLVLTGIIITITPIRAQLDVARDRIEEKKEIYEDFQERYREADPESERKETIKERLESANDDLSEARMERIKLLVDKDFHKNNLSIFWDAVFHPLVYMLFFIVGLFVIGKTMGGTGGFKEIVAGVGTASLIYLISLIIIPLIGKIPNLEFIVALNQVVNIMFVLLSYMAFKFVYNLEGEKAVMSMFIVLSLATILASLISGGGLIQASTSNNELDEFFNSLF